MQNIIDSIANGFKQNLGEIIGAGLAWCIAYLFMRYRVQIWRAVRKTLRFAAAALIILAAVFLWMRYESYLQPSGAGSRDEARTQYLRGLEYQKAEKYTEALTCFRSAAERGNPEAQYTLGIIYSVRFSIRYGVIPDADEARKWFQRAAEQGHTGAQERLKGLDTIKPKFKGIGRKF